ncbi:hypothetical protein [Nostoc sp. UHCC 0251]|uniref:hypothetical protein n=1 Tax=Nostoc sp. UHCC 0251 TaxID=3110240 RepID=UPI002B219D50|nr:hypothetical protein [Nostoc sp. UHCC 0251]MEA5622858.1 hypothetical protein [Nostoc sp. UHCC 0251]
MDLSRLLAPPNLRNTKISTDHCGKGDFSENIFDYHRSNTRVYKYSSDRKLVRLDDKLTSSLNDWG